MNKANLFLIFGTILYILTFLIGSYHHEEVHKLIFDLYGCKNVTIHIGIPRSYTTANCNLTLAEMREMEKLHIMNEAIAYNLVPWLAGLFGLNLMGWFLVLLPNRREEKNMTG